MCLCSIAALFYILDFIIRNYTTYGIAKDMPGPYMLPIIGATQFFLSPQGELSTFKLFYFMCWDHLNNLMVHFFYR